MCPLFVFVRVWECAFMKMHKWKCSRARDRWDGFHTFYVHLHAYKINSSRFTHGMEWNGCMRFVDTKQLFQACNNNSNKREESEREQQQKIGKQKYLSLQIMTLGCWNGDGIHSGFEKLNGKYANAKMPADPNKQCGLTFVLHKQWKGT